jgi:hypothetical protein
MGVIVIMAAIVAAIVIAIVMIVVRDQRSKPRS